MSDHPGGMTWRVMRRDDNGNDYLVEDGLTEAEATQRAAELARGAHKQTYWIERSHVEPTTVPTP